MRAEAVPDPAGWLLGLGGLHDVSILRVAFDARAGRVALEVDDLNWNFEGFPGHVRRPCTLVFSGLAGFSFAAGEDRFHTSLLAEGAVIAEAHAISKGEVTRMDIAMSTGERWHVEFARLEIEDQAG